MPFCTWMTLGASFSACGTPLLAWGSWTARFVTAAARPRLGMQPAPVHNSRGALRAYDFRVAWEHCRLLPGHTRLSVKPQSVPPEKALDPAALAAHMKKVFGATSSPASPPSSASATQPGVHRSVITLQALRQICLLIRLPSPL